MKSFQQNGKREGVYYTLFHENNFNKNSQPQIWYFKIRYKLTMKTKKGDHMKHFRHITPEFLIGAQTCKMVIFGNFGNF